MWNSLTVSYVALVTVATVLVVLGAVAGVRMAWRWPHGAPLGEERDDYDRQHHLVVTLVRVGTIAIIVVVPLWFAALASLVPAVEGGMCMASVHNLGSPGSWVASALKAAVPALLLYWLVVDRADRARDDEALLPHKLRLLLPVALVAFGAAVLDLHFLFSLELGPSPCCMTLFDGPGVGTGLDGRPGWEWTSLFGASFLLLGVVVAAARRPGFADAARTVALVLVPLLVGSLVLALHTRLGSAVMGFSHHCIFCVWKEQPLSFGATALVAFGAWWLGARAALAGAVPRTEPASPRLGRPYALVALGAAILVVLVALEAAR